MNKIYDRVSSLAETEYIIQCDSGAHLVGTYDGGTDAVREYTAVKLVKFPGNEVLDETTGRGQASCPGSHSRLNAEWFDSKDRALD